MTMARMPYYLYAKKHEYALSKKQLMYWAREHKKAVEENDRETIEWIEAMLTDMNFHSECALFIQGRYKEAIANFSNF